MKEFVQRLIQDITVPADTYLDQDEEILEIFAEEVAEIIVELVPLFSHWQNDLQALDEIKIIRRHFHTLKGSGRMVGTNQLGEFAWTIEDLLNAVIQDPTIISEQIRQYCTVSFEFYQFYLQSSIQSQQPLAHDIRVFLLVGRALKKNGIVDTALLSEVVDQSQTGIIANDDTSAQLSANSNEDEFIDANGSHLNKSLDIPSVYLDEVAEHLEKIRVYLGCSEPSIKETSGLIRAIHTLKGSSGMMQIDDLVEVSGNIELSLNLELQEKGKLDVSLSLLEQFEVFLGQYLHGLTDSKPELLETCLAQFNTVWAQYEEYIKRSEHDQIRINDIISLDIDHLLDAADEFDINVWKDAETYLVTLIDENKILTQWAASKKLVDLVNYLLKLHQAYAILLAIAFSDYDALKVESQRFNDFHNALMIYFDFLASGQINPVLLQLEEEVDILIHELSDVRKKAEQPLVVPTPHIPTPQIIEKLGFDQISIDRQAPNVLDDSELIEIFVEEAEEIVAQMDIDLTEFENNSIQLVTLKKLMRHLHTLKGSANMIQAVHLGSVAHHLESVYELLIHQKMEVTPLLLAIVRCIQDKLAERIDIIRQQKVDFSSEHTIALLDSLKHGQNYDFDAQQRPTVVFDSVVEVDKNLTELSENHQELTTQTEQSLSLLEQVKIAFEAWCDERTSRSLLLGVQRAAYTLRDDVQQIKLPILVDLTQHLVDTFEQYSIYQVQSDIHDHLIFNALSTLEQLFSGVFEQSEVIKNRDALAAIRFVDLSSTGFEVKGKSSRVDAEYLGDGTEPPSMHGLWSSDSEASINQEMIRVSATTIDKVTNLTAETAINRSRVEMGLNQFTATLSEMELAIVRLSEQLRRMEGELETQIIAKHGIESDREDFDPLEMDKYSALNQLSKSLAESASDLLDFKSTLADKVVDSESLLLEQARMQTDVQDNLLGVRRVVFSLIESRLQRLVRQTAMSINRSVELQVVNANLEIDRSVLDRLVTPLEHMLRNAIGHGIENTRERIQKDKPKVGKVQIKLSRQGTDILLEIQDDGRGIDADQIRRKAYALGLISERDNLADVDVLQLIFSSGFSTAQELTQLSGRGVGLDVVNNEIRALGGHISVESVKDQGTLFIIRIPTIMTVTDALMVKVADQQFAVPLSQIERITSMSLDAVKKYFSTDAEYYRIDGQEYRLRYLSEFLGYSKQQSLVVNETLPVLLVRGYNNQLVGLLVDQLVGSRIEIVVKPLNNQLKHIQTLGGATILADGRICFILDAQNIARSAQNTQRHRYDMMALNAQNTTALRNTVMIVDDSVTVRKVTSRLLERHGYNVITAKDGIDAIEKLETLQPDMMLLDIEMPRMDGFEVAKLVRTDAVHKALPIIMITSRTGLKHREHALSLGVNYYMGKPFQEDALLEQIEIVLHDLKGELNVN